MRAAIVHAIPFFILYEDDEACVAGIAVGRVEQSGQGQGGRRKLFKEVKSGAQWTERGRISRLVYRLNLAICIQASPTALQGTKRDRGEAHAKLQRIRISGRWPVYVYTAASEA